MKYELTRHKFQFYKNFFEINNSINFKIEIQSERLKNHKTSGRVELGKRGFYKKGEAPLEKNTFGERNYFSILIIEFLLGGVLTFSFRNVFRRKHK